MSYLTCLLSLSFIYKWDRNSTHLIEMLTELNNLICSIQKSNDIIFAVIVLSFINTSVNLGYNFYNFLFTFVIFWSYSMTCGILVF